MGAAFIVFDKAGNTIHSAQYKLPSQSNNFLAETVAIAKEIAYIKEHSIENHYQILTDSLSTLQGLRNPNNTNYFIQRLREMTLTETSLFKISLTYVKAHYAIMRNEIADKLANKSRVNGRTVDIPRTEEFIKRELSKESKRKWNSIWHPEKINTSFY